MPQKKRRGGMASHMCAALLGAVAALWACGGALGLEASSTLMRAGRWREARAALALEVASAPNDAVAALQYTCLGECCVKCHDDVAAVSAFASALALDAGGGG